MKKLNLLTYGIFFAFVLVYWGIKKMGYSIDSHTYLMVMVFMLFLLYVIRKIVLFQKITNKQEPHERAYGDDAVMGEEEPVPTNPLDEMKRMEKKVTLKRAVFIIIVFVALIGLKYGSRVMIADMLLDGFDTREEYFADIDRKREFREMWEEYRKEEMKNGGPAYLVEDVFATTLKPDHWKDFFVLTAVPDGFYYRDRYMQSSSRGDHIITEVFYDLETESEFFYFVQSADYDYNKGHVPDGMRKKEGQFYQEDKGARNQIIWFYDDLTLYLEGNLPMDVLEQIAKSAVNYNTLQYDYSAIEGATGIYE